MMTSRCMLSKIPFTLSLSIVNLSLQKVIFPDKMKIAKVIPVYKAGDPSRFVNYRPFSLEPAFSKFLE